MKESNIGSEITVLIAICSSVSSLLTCQILIFADVRMSPWVITPVCYALVFSNPNQTIRAVVELGFPKLAFPIPITVLNVTHDLGLC